LIHVSSYTPAKGTDVMNSQTPSDALVQPPRGSHDFEPVDPQNCWSIAEKRDKFNNKSQQIQKKFVNTLFSLIMHGGLKS